jgi:hypothetical protein
MWQEVKLSSFSKILHLTEFGQINTCPKGQKIVASSFYVFFTNIFITVILNCISEVNFCSTLFHSGVNLHCENTARSYFQHFNMVQSVISVWAMKLSAIRKHAGQSLECTYMMQINVHSRRVNGRERK